MFPRPRFNRMELAGSLGDLGTLLPIAMAMILINGLSPSGLFFTVGIFYLASGLFAGVTTPVQPMKVIGAYAVATAMEPSQIQASSLLMGIFLLAVALTGTIDFIGKYTPKSTIRGVQLSTGILLISGGIKFILGTSAFQTMEGAAEPFLHVQSLGPIPLGICLGTTACILILFLLENKRFPAGLMVILGGLGTGLFMGKTLPMEMPGIHLPPFLPFGLPPKADLTFALFVLVLPQLPMTMGNAVLAYTDLSHQYFGEKAHRLSNKNVCISMALANFLSFCFGGMPLCHGAGGLAAHHRFGARTAGSNLMIGGIFIALVLFLGNDIIKALKLIPMAVLGALLIFAGAQLALTIMDLKTRKEYFVATLIIGITLAANLAAGFMVGLITAHLLKWKKLSI